MNSKVSCAVAAILGAVSCAAAGAARAADATTAAADTSSDAIIEVTVTATRRSESMQRVPISMQAFTEQTLQQLNIQTFDDYIKYLPNLTAASNGPGQNELFMRGLSAGSQASQGSGSTGVWPNVAVYLDNQSGQLPNRNLDIYAADLNRIEILEGPQGTLFGAGAEAGVIRYITNEPKLDVTEGSIKAGYGITAHGDPNSDVTAVLNLPLVPNVLAARAVIYGDHRGGYINNVPATFTRSNTDIGISAAAYPAVNGACPDGLPNAGYCVPPGSSAINNAGVQGSAINPVTYTGGRLELKLQLSDDWDVLLSQSYQDMDASGVFYQQPRGSDGTALNPLEVTLFNPAHDKDRFESTALTLNGKLGPLKAVYTGGYLVRNVDQIGDYTNYARGVYADYYQCYGPGYYTPYLPSKCFSPNASWHSVEQNMHQQHEFRLSTPDEWRFRGIAGVFWEKNVLYDQTGWLYKNVPTCTSDATPGTLGNGDTGCFTDVGTFPGTSVQNPGVQGDHVSFYQDQVRETKQLAFFASFDFDIIPKTLTLTLGTRHYRFDNSMAGSVLSSFGCFQGGVPAGGCHAGFSYNLNADNLSDTESGFKSRGNLTWHITRDLMVYYTFSQGFRPGGFNQNGNTAHAFTPSGDAQSDKLTNNEIGWKTEFADHRLQWNGAIYRETWDNAQVAFFDPGVIGNIFFNTNGQNFVVKGIEMSFAAKIAGGFTLQAAGSYNNSRQTNSPGLIDNNVGQVSGVAASPTAGQVISNACNAFLTACAPVVNPFGPVGSPTANSPKLQFSTRARYDWAIGGYLPFVQFGLSHTGSSFTQAGANPTFAVGGAVSTSRGRFENPSYTTYDASCGVSKDAWTATLYAENLSNSNASTFVSTDQFIVAQTPLRPRVLGVSFGFKF